MARAEMRAETETKVPVTTEKTSTAMPGLMQPWRPFESLRREVDRLFEDFTMNPFRLPLRRPAFDLEPFWSRSPGSPRRRSISSSTTTRSKSLPNCRDSTKRTSK